MAHTYVFQTITYPNVAAGDQQVAVTGTVDGLSVTASCWLSEYLKKANSVIAAETYLAGIMLAALPPTPTAPPNAPTGLTITI